VIFQPLSGLWLMNKAGWNWQTPWLLASIGLFVLAGLCWLPVVVLQLRMAALGTTGLPGVCCDGGGVLPDGGQACASQLADSHRAAQIAACNAPCFRLDDHPDAGPHHLMALQVSNFEVFR
jgi:hypothetical protein